ncbi:metallophosphoesterase [Marinifilum fragile]|uniref:metallophosphoesterase n=1 Tax=Marinifilum fragile TaxID=570161 RepID=UPI002AA8938F|nr:metallophosphoesterase [Marinifilum fragile]
MIRDISSGKLMIVSDLHGNGFDFRQILKVYGQQKERGRADYLVFLGDLIHAYPGKMKDESRDMVMQLMEMGANQPDSDIICLLGNHEFVHIYHIPLQKGPLEFTSWFENRIRKNREEIIRFFMNMPFMIRTQGGVLITHTGASDRYGENEKFDLQWLKNYKHQPEFNDHIKNIGKYDPYVGADFMHTQEGDFLWDILMNGNEKQYKEEYEEMVSQMLHRLSEDRKENPLRILVSGHIGVDYGAEMVGEKQLRICSSAGCLRDLEKKFMLISAEKEYADSEALLNRCFDLF